MPVRSSGETESSITSPAKLERTDSSDPGIDTVVQFRQALIPDVLLDGGVYP